MPGEPYNHIGDIVSHMKTTFNIDEALMRQLRIEAARRGVTMKSMVESGIRHVIANGNSGGKARNSSFKVKTYPMGIKVDVANRDELYRVMEED